jgi:hypothetical protein
MKARLRPGATRRSSREVAKPFIGANRPSLVLRFPDRSHAELALALQVGYSRRSDQKSGS